MIHSQSFKTKKEKKIKIIRSGDQTQSKTSVSGYPLVVLAFGNEINWNHLYFKRIESDCCRRITPLWATATIRARPIGSTICNAVGTLGKHFTLAYGHVALSYTKPTACRKVRNTEKYHNIFVA
jgi:hypothetical protein